jgi:hypothetical protein
MRSMLAVPTDTGNVNAAFQEILRLAITGLRNGP